VKHINAKLLVIDGKIKLQLTFNITVDSDDLGLDLDDVDEIEDMHRPYNDHDDHDFLVTEDIISV
jgi:hypothetical protein